MIGAQLIVVGEHRDNPSSRGLLPQHLSLPLIFSDMDGRYYLSGRGDVEEQLIRSASFKPPQHRGADETVAVSLDARQLDSQEYRVDGESLQILCPQLPPQVLGIQDFEQPGDFKD